MAHKHLAVNNSLYPGKAMNWGITGCWFLQREEWVGTLESERLGYRAQNRHLLALWSLQIVSRLPNSVSSIKNGGNIDFCNALHLAHERYLIMVLKWLVAFLGVNNHRSGLTPAYYPQSAFSFPSQDQTAFSSSGRSDHSHLLL